MKIPVTSGRLGENTAGLIISDYYYLQYIIIICRTLLLFAVHFRKMNEVIQAIQAQLFRHPASGNLGGTSNSNYCRLMLRSVEFGATVAAERRRGGLGGNLN